MSKKVKNSKYRLPIVILLLILIITSGKYISGRFGTSHIEDDGQKNISSSKFLNFHRPRHILESQMSDGDSHFILPNKTATIVATGDIMFHTTQIISAFNKENGRYDFRSVFEKVKPYISSADLAIANFESVVAGPQYRYTGYPTFNSPIETLQALKATGLDVLSTANNHSLDKGKHGLINTIDKINELGMDSIGTYKEPSERVRIKEINGIKIGLLAYTYGCNGLESLLTTSELGTMVNIIDENKIKRDIEKADELGADITAVVIHWGNEYQLSPSNEQIQLGEKMVQWGADIILGSHPHVIQKSEIINHNGSNKFIIYSMGNFISNQRRETLDLRNDKYTEDGIIVKLQIEKDAFSGETTIKDIDYIPTWVNRYEGSDKFVYEVLPTTDYLGNKDSELSEEVYSKIEESYNQTISKMSQQ
ncbi:CapA family protein [Sporosalibacterium faouarense]|uniref:CapA family protein n=1 Tax=Sporosalibacterium faouarense TaxID=516123 RepID=UPI00141C52CE|nr:CapA family protein [Sporosalibacterium faouarense]MTI49746.1 CapA family protein [Bacillota bacterium]